MSPDVYCTLPIRGNPYMEGQTVKMTRASLWHILSHHCQGKNPEGQHISSCWDPCLEKVDDLMTILSCTLLFGEVCMPKQKSSYIRISRHYPHVIGWEENDPYTHRAIVWADLHTTLLQSFRPDSCLDVETGELGCSSRHHHKYGGLPGKACFRLHFPTNAKEAAKTNDRKMWHGCPKCGLTVLSTHY